MLCLEYGFCSSQNWKKVLWKKKRKRTKKILKKLWYAEKKRIKLKTAGKKLIVGTRVSLKFITNMNENVDLSIIIITSKFLKQINKK